VKYHQDEVKTLIFQERFGILLKMRLSAGVGAKDEE
jgi:hypothetical protein